MNCPDCNAKPMAVTKDIIWFSCGRSDHFVEDLSSFDIVFSCEKPRRIIHRCFIPTEADPKPKTFAKWMEEVCASF